MAKLLLDEGRRVVGLLDGDTQGAQTIARLKKVTGEAISRGDLLVHSLGPDQSIEDVVPHPELLVEATIDAMKEHVTTSGVGLRPTVTMEQAEEKLRSCISSKPTGVTLGRALVDATAHCMADSNGLSKINIACRYEDKLAKHTCKTDCAGPALQSLVRALSAHLDLRSRVASADVVERDTQPKLFA